VAQAGTTQQQPKEKGVPETLQPDNLAPQSITWSKIFKELEMLIIMM